MLLQAGDARIGVPFWAIPILYSAPIALMALVVSSNVLSTPAKQCLSIPLLASEILVPIAFTANNAVIDLTCSVVGYNAFIRFFDFFWISPILYGKPAYADMDYLHTELWSSMRKFPKKKEEKPKEYVKDKKFYHILIRLFYHAAICDIFGAWYATFSGRDAMALSAERPVLFFFFLCIAVFVLNSAFNAIGCGLQLFYCIYYEGGSYSSEQWRPLMMDPIISTSLDELWSVRWHQLLRTSWVAFGFRPMRFITQRALAKTVKNPLPIALMMGAIAVFAVSGLMHEYIIYCNVGWTVYRQFFAGQQFFFFFIHGIGMASERILKQVTRGMKFPRILARIVSHAWVFAWAYYTFPYFLDGFAYWHIWKDNPFEFVQPYVIDFLRAIPQARALCGSLL